MCLVCFSPLPAGFPESWPCSRAKCFYSNHRQMIFFKWRVHVEHWPESSGGFSLLAPALVSPEEETGEGTCRLLMAQFTRGRLGAGEGTSLAWDCAPY